MGEMNEVELGLEFIDPNGSDVHITVQKSMFTNSSSVFIAINNSGRKHEFAHAHMPAAEAEELALAILTELANQGKLSFSLGGVSLAD